MAGVEPGLVGWRFSWRGTERNEANSWPFMRKTKAVMLLFRSLYQPTEALLCCRCLEPVPEGHGDLSKVAAKVGGVPAEVYFARAQGEFAGLDQVNVQLPKELTYPAELTVELTVTGKAANLVRLAIN